MIAKTYSELERPVGWLNTPVDMDNYLGEIDYFEVEVEADALIEIDRNYGADADGNRGVTADFSYIEKVTVTLYGDFRPWYIKARDYVKVPWKNLFHKGRKPITWRQLSDYHFIEAGEEVLSNPEFLEAQEALLEVACDFSDDDYWSRGRWH